MSHSGFLPQKFFRFLYYRKFSAMFYMRYFHDCFFKVFIYLTIFVQAFSTSPKKNCEKPLGFPKIN